MNLKGILNRNKKGDLILFDSGESVNITNLLTDNLLTKVRLVLKSSNGRAILNETGKLIMDKVDKGIYKFSINGNVFQGMLSDLVGSKIGIELYVIHTEEIEDEEN